MRREVRGKRLGAEGLAFAVEVGKGVHRCDEDSEVGDGEEEGEGEDLHLGGGVGWRPPELWFVGSAKMVCGGCAALLWL